MKCMSLCKLCLNMWGWQERWGPLRKGSEGRWARRREAWEGKMSSQHWLLGEFFWRAMWTLYIYQCSKKGNLGCLEVFPLLSLVQKAYNNNKNTHLFKTQIWCQDDHYVIFDDQQMAKNFHWTRWWLSKKQRMTNRACKSIRWRVLQKWLIEESAPLDMNINFCVLSN